MITLPECRTEASNARRFANAHRQDVRWVDAWGQWLVWDGQRWSQDDCKVFALAKSAMNEIWDEVTEHAKEADNQTIRAMTGFAIASNSARGVREMLTLARSERGIPVRPDDLDTDPWLLNVANGTIDLRTGRLRPHDRADMVTKMVPVAHDADAECPTWDKFTRRILPDDSLRNYVRRLAGYCLSGAIREHVLPILWGSGANGKSTLIDTLLALAGDYGHKAPSDLLLATRDDSHPTAIADLLGKRMVACVETGDGRRLAETLVKEMSGGDKITARKMRQDYFTFTSTHKLILATNHKPVVRGTDHAIWRRIRLVPFTVTIPEAEQDPELKTKLLAELPGILNWVLDGCVEWQSQGLGTPGAVEDATGGYRSEMDLIGRFILERCVTGEGIQAGATEIYRAYRDWCESGGERSVNQTVFGERLSERGFVSKKTKSVVLRIGISLNGGQCG